MSESEKPMVFGSLFSGFGGMDLGLERARMQCAWQVEINEYAQKVLQKHWPHVAKFRDVRECGKHNLSPVDLIAGGFPCQDISDAGEKAGIDGDRSGLYREQIRIVRELRPRYVILENVAALLHRGINRVLGDLAACGYDAEWTVLSAEAVGAPHLRERVFIVAYAKGKGCPTRGFRGWFEASRETQIDAPYYGSQIVPYPDFQGLEVGACFREDAYQELASFERSCSSRSGQWAVEPGICRVADGVPHRVERLRGLGNAVVVQVAQFVGLRIQALEARTRG